MSLREARTALEDESVSMIGGEALEDLADPVVLLDGSRADAELLRGSIQRLSEGPRVAEAGHVSLRVRSWRALTRCGRAEWHPH